MRTASQLGPCGWVDVLSAKRVRSKSQQRAMDLGTKFHGGVESWIRTGVMPELRPAQIADWLAGLTSSWVPPPGVEVEVALGLSPSGKHVPVTEPEPHVYVPVEDGAQLMTAGRADFLWVADGCLFLGDWKTGRTDPGIPDRRPQLLALGLAAADRAGVDHMALGLYLAREVQWRWSDIIDLSSEQAAAMWDEVKLMAELGPEPRVGPHCDACWERPGCSAVAP